MVNNQITPFQLTDQFTMDNFNQRINETNTALQNKAPAGYGLGGSSPAVTDFNLCRQNGWYGGASSTINGPEKIEYNAYGAVHVRRGNSIIVCQDYYIFDSDNLPYGLLATRFSSDYGVNWSPWEYVNPEMKIGVEYRTTERYLGKPVYVKVVDVGAMPNTTTKAVSHGVANIDQCISATGITIISTGDTFSIPYASMSDGMTNGCSFSRTQVRVWSAGDNSTANANVLIKYTKTTD